MERTIWQKYIYGEDKPIPVAKTLDELVEIFKRDAIGKPCQPHFRVECNDVADRKAIFRFAWTCGDDNPLYTDPEYAAKTRYGCLIAPPTFAASLKCTTGSKAFAPWDVPGAIKMGSSICGLEFDNFDVIRVNDRFTFEHKYANVEKKVGGQWGEFLLAYTDSYVWNQHGECPTIQHGWSCCPPAETIKAETTAHRRGRVQESVADRQIYRYTDEERAKIQHAIDSEVRRGSKPRLWEDVNFGDEIPGVVKGPLSIGDLVNVRAHIMGPAWRSMELHYQDLKDQATGKVNMEGASVNSAMNWPFSPGLEHEDWILCRNRAMPLPFDEGIGRAAWSYHMFSNWMGDDGFLRKLKVVLRRWHFYGDTLFYSGKVVKKEKTTEGNAVYIDWKAINQLGELITMGDATVLLPKRTEEVHLPTPRMPKKA